MGKLKPINPTKAQIVANPQAAAHDYDNLTHKPQINGHELVGNKTGDDLGLQNKLTAGENITINANGEISASGGTDDYEALTNKPRINGHELVGDKTSAELGLQSLLTVGYKFGENSYYETALSGAIISSDSVIISRSTYDESRYDYSFRIHGDYAFHTYHPTRVDLNDLGKNNYVGNSYLKIAKVRITNLPSFVNATDNSIIAILNFGMYDYRLQFISWKDPVTNISRLAFRHVDLTVNNWREITEITSAVVNQNGTITFTMSDGSTVTTTGESVIGPQGDDYDLTPQDKSDIAAIVLSELPTTQGVLYGNTSN